ncbi:alanine racemase [Nonomuraea jiangxiensis]|uniref:Diaminopimelate decarboxylase n=1 Tax=Nonomuraea jiangxiensis TaxID=633440 RepID=A0A1G9BZR0_9ACTN|nr:alanine racemase [Nonomuraea jiangxiensis]SDK44415.1 diaminopimelate decarboxylase [Nonomuraea jiangxiensis]
MAVTALLSSQARALLEADRGLLAELAYGLRGPFHVLFPDRFEANLRAFRAVMKAVGVEGQIHYAKKANKAACFVERCAEEGAGVDVASVGELRDALGHGVRGERIVVTGPAKADELLRLATHHGCLITVDSLDELERVARLEARIMLRALPPGRPHSRFGMTAEELDTALRRRGRARLEGFSFHLTGYDPAERAEVAAWLVEWCERTASPAVDTISIGGGFAVDYTGRPVDITGHRFHADRAFTDFYPYHSSVSGPDALRAVLSTGGLGRRLRERGIRLLIEPGRALLDQAGMTVFQVQGVKARDYGIITVDGTSLSLSEQWFNSEFLPEPRPVPVRPGGPFEACVGGASCLESDLLTWRRITLPGRPRAGDLLVYPNTAGYQMDSNESRFHELPLPPKVVIEADGRWRLDRAPS